MGSQSTAPLPASELSASLNEVSECFTNRSALGFRPVLDGPDIILSGTATAVTKTDLEMIEFTADACATALYLVQKRHNIDPKTRNFSEVQRQEFGTIATYYMTNQFEYLQAQEEEPGTVSESCNYHVLDSGTWKRLVEEDRHKVIRMGEWTEAGRIVTNAWERYAKSPATNSREDADDGTDSDGGRTYVDAVESQEPDVEVPK